MARIYISSTYVDLKKEREAAAKAVRRLGHQPVYMEDYVASPQQPVEKCLQDVRTCDAYVGIFAWRYGFIPHGYHKSITHLEYETAKKQGIPCLIFLTDIKAQWTVEYITTGEERTKIDRLRKELMNEYIVSFFKNEHELNALVTAAVSNIKFQEQIPSTAARDKPKLGPIVSKKCDRNPQVNDFMKFFREKSEKCPKRPQFYFIHGDEWEGHNSLLIRLMKTCLKNYAVKQWGEKDTSICLEEVPWPKKGNLSQRKEDLKLNLTRRFDKFYEMKDSNANTLCRLPYFDKRPLVLIKHNIYSSKWDKHTEESLIAWYIKDFWAAFDCHEYEDIPIFLVFFNVKYQHSPGSAFMQKIWKRDSHTKARIREQLHCLASHTDDRCPCRLLRELESIEPEDVSDWLSENNIAQQEWVRKEIIDSVFIEDNRPVTSICWAKLEKKLLTILELIEKCQYQSQYKKEELFI